MTDRKAAFDRLDDLVRFESDEEIIEGNAVKLDERKEFRPRRTFMPSGETAPDDASTDVAWVSYITIRAPGETKQVIVTPVTAEHKGRYPMFYARWRKWVDAGCAEPFLVGTSLRDWESIPPLDVKGWEVKGVKTVEALAAISDADLPKFPMMSARRLRDLAVEHLDSLKRMQPITEVKRENEALKQRVADLQLRVDAQIGQAPADLNALVAAAVAKALAAANDDGKVKRGPGRPPKNGAGAELAD